jgi:hypothetical protein
MKEHKFIIPQPFVIQQNEYIMALSWKELRQFSRTKDIFRKDIFDKSLVTHCIYETTIKWEKIKAYSSYINWKDRIIFFIKDEDIYLYEIMIDHDYKKLLRNIKLIINIIYENFLSHK